MEAKTILSTIGIILSVASTLAPSFAIYLRIKSGKLKEISVNFLRLGHLCQLCRLLYSIMIQDIGLMIANGVNTVISAVNLFIYVGNTQVIVLFMQRYVAAFVFGNFLVFYAANEQIMGYFCFLLSALASLSAVESIQNAVRQKDYRYIDINIAVCITLSSLVWTWYGVLAEEPIVAISSCGGALVGILLISFHCYLKRKTRHILFKLVVFQ